MTVTDPATEVAELDAVAQAELVRRGEATATELVTWAIERIERLNPTLNAVITPMYEQVLSAASTSTPSGRLSGVPFLVKDLVTRCPGFRSAKDRCSCAGWSLIGTPSWCGGYSARA